MDQKIQPNEGREEAMRYGLILMLGFVTMGTLGAQESADPPNNAATQPPENPLPRLDDVKPPESVFLIVCDANPDKIIVLNGQGKWIPTVKEAMIKFQTGIKPKITCMMYSGFYKPTNPEVKVWQIAQLKSVTPVEFQQMIDSLQKDPESIKKAIPQN